MDYVARTQEDVVRTYSEHFKVVLVTGPRQVGKTTMLRHLVEHDEAGRRAYVSLDNTADRLLARQDPELFLQRHKPPVLIDEVQYAPELLPYVKLLVDADARNGLVWLTGSQPFHLMRGVSESLAGRVGIVELLGLSNAELSGVASEPFVPGEEYFVRRMVAAQPADLAQTFERIATGSFPGIASLPADLRPAAYDALVDTYLLRDIRDLGNVTDELRFRRFLSACAALTARPVVYAELARVADVDEKTAKAWLSLLVSSYLVKIVSPYHNNLLKRLGKRPVMHFMDTGLAARLAGWDNAVALERGAYGGQIFETHAFAEIYKSHVASGVRPSLWFFRDNDGREIDLLLEREGTLHPIEVRKSADPGEKALKNLSALDPIAARAPRAKTGASDRAVGMGCVVCMASDARPIDRRAWAFPVWAV